MGTGKSKLAIKEYDPEVDIPANVTVFIFVRHATSCANLRKESISSLRFTHTDILDPGLTRKGIYDARKKGEKLRGKLESNYGKIQPTVCASVLLRTQMTAYLMMNPNLNDKYHIRILPYISEEGNRYQDDNKPRNFDDQKKMLEELKPVFENMVREGYNEYKGDNEPDKLKPDFTKFTKELEELCKNNNEKLLKNVPVPTTRCSVKNKTVNISERDTRTAYAPIVIVTHGHVLEKFFDKEHMGRPLKDKSERPNFAAFRVYFNHNTNEFIRNPVDTNDKDKKSVPYFYRYDNTLTEKLDKEEECKWEKGDQACESDVCDPNVNVTSTKYIGGRRTRRKSRKRTQKNS